MQKKIADGDLILETRGAAGLIRLNRPKAINSLNRAMVEGMKAALEEFASSPDIVSVVLLGEGERGLCAGGDVRAIYDVRTASEMERTQFWRDEFPLNYMISRFPKPYIALMDGIVMGGGVGISAHGTHRIVTERTRLAMPETAIGYFPDVGASWLLPKAPGESGAWLALTGREIGAADAIHAGLADVHVASEKLPALIEAVSVASDAEEIGNIITRFSSQPLAGILADNQKMIDNIFSHDKVETIFRLLEQESDAFSQETLSLLKMRSPTSLKLTLRLLRKGRDSSGLVECLEREFAAGCAVLNGHEFYEGVRAALVDKDRNPKWKPTSIDDVSEEDIDGYFIRNTAPLFPDHRL